METDGVPGFVFVPRQPAAALPARERRPNSESEPRSPSIQHDARLPEGGSHRRQHGEIGAGSSRSSTHRRSAVRASIKTPSHSKAAGFHIPHHSQPGGGSASAGRALSLRPALPSSRCISPVPCPPAADPEAARTSVFRPPRLPLPTPRDPNFQTRARSTQSTRAARTP